MGARGFTLVELMVVVAIVALLTLVALPSFKWIYNIGRLTTPANEMVATLQIARSESIRRNARTVVCRSDLPNATNPTCIATAGPWPGWIAFVDSNKDGQHQATETMLRSSLVNSPIEIRPSAVIATESNRIVFRSDGLARASSTSSVMKAIISVCVPDASIGENAREVGIAAGSRLSVARVTEGGTCATPPDSRLP